MSAEKKVVDLMAALEESIRKAKEDRLRQQAARTGGEDAIRREVEACEQEEIERTELAREAFRRKMREMRETGGIPGYVGPRATRDA